MKEGYWRDIGSFKDYVGVHYDLLGREGRVVDPTAHLEEGVILEGLVCLGKGVHIAPHARIKDSIVWDDVRIEEEGTLEGCIVADRCVVRGEHREEVLLPT